MLLFSSPLLLICPPAGRNWTSGVKGECPPHLPLLHVSLSLMCPWINRIWFLLHIHVVHDVICPIDVLRMSTAAAAKWIHSSLVLLVEARNRASSLLTSLSSLPSSHLPPISFSSSSSAWPLSISPGSGLQPLLIEPVQRSAPAL